MGYDRAATMFAPDGHILQVEYAEKTVRLGLTSVGIVCEDSVVIVSEVKNEDSLVVKESTNKINDIDDHVICVFAGISSDARVLIDKARLSAQQYRMTYDSKPGVESIVRDIADIEQQFTQYGGARPFGVSMMFAGIDDEPVLYTTDITGSYLKYKANAIGKDDSKVRKLLRKKYKEGLSQKDGLKLILDIFKEIRGEDFDIEKFDAGILSKDKGIIVISKISGKNLF